MSPYAPPELESDELSLEEIMKEFGSAEPEPEPVSQPEPEAAPVSGDTIVMPPLQASPEAAIVGDTLIFETIDAPEIEPAAEMEAFAALEPAVAETEPFSEDWEPEYEEPMGEYTPKAPIPFPTKNRLRALRQKLVAGPERRFQDLSEIGIGKLQIGIVLNFVLAALSIGLTVGYTLGFFSPERLRTVIFCQLLLAMLAALVGSYRMLDGIILLLRGRFTLDASLFIAFAVCVADGLLCLYEQRLSCSSLFCLQVLFAQAGAYQRRSTELSQMDVLRKANDLTALVKVEDFWKAHPGYVTRDGEPEEFLDHYRKPSAPEKALSLYAIIALIVSAGLAIAVGVLKNMATGIQIFMIAQLMTLPVTAFVSMSRPTAILQNRLHRLGAVICGWQGIRAAEKHSVFPLTHADLFPEGTIKMNGVKFYGTVDPGRVVSYTTALISAEESGMLRVFHLMPRSRDSAEHTVEDFTEHPGGIAGLVDGYPVLVGTAQCMEASGISLPENSKIPHAIYAAVDGQLSGVFAVSYSRSKFSAQGVRTLCGDRRVVPAVIACDFMLTPRFLREKLSVNSKRLVFPDRATRLELSRLQPAENCTVIALMTREGLASKAYALTGARALQGALKAGAAVHILGGILGLTAVAVLTLCGGIALLTPTNLLLYTALWSIPGLLITEHTRYI